MLQSILNKINGNNENEVKDNIDSLSVREVHFLACNIDQAIELAQDNEVLVDYLERYRAYLRIGL